MVCYIVGTDNWKISIYPWCRWRSFINDFKIFFSQYYERKNEIDLQRNRVLNIWKWFFLIINDGLSMQQNMVILNADKSFIWVKLMMFSATFNNISVISWRSVLLILVEETGMPGEKHRPAVSFGHTWSHNVVSNASRHELDSNSQL